MHATDLVPSVSISNLLAQRNAIAERLRQIATLLIEVGELSEAAFGSDDAVPSLQCQRVHAYLPGDVEALVKRVDATAWDFLMNKSGLRTFMDAKAREQWTKDIYERRVPALTQENIEETFKELFAARREMFERGVVEVFRHLSWDYKTNNPRLFGKRIVLRRIVEVWGSGGQKYHTGPSLAGCNGLDDLIRVMSVLDGRPEPDHRQGAYNALREVITFDTRFPVEPVAIADLISIRCFKNSNGHLTFLRPDLVDRLNEIVAKHHPGALPPAEDRGRA